MTTWMASKSVTLKIEANLISKTCVISLYVKLPNGKIIVTKNRLVVATGVMNGKVSGYKAITQWSVRGIALYSNCGRGYTNLHM